MTLKREQRDKLADFFITIGAGWFIATVVSPFFALTQTPQYHIMMGIGNVFANLAVALIILDEK